jgi:hypothetical protein
VLGSKSRIVFVRKDYADIELRVPTVEEARDLIGFEAKVNLDEGTAHRGWYTDGHPATWEKARGGLKSNGAALAGGPVEERRKNLSV